MKNGATKKGATTRLLAFLNQQNLEKTYIFLFLLLSYIFIIPVLSDPIGSILEQVFLYAIFVMALTYAGFHGRFIIFLIVLGLIGNMVDSFFRLEWVHTLTRLTNLLFFLYSTLAMIILISGSKQVNAMVIFEAVNGYLMLGLMFSVIFTLVLIYDPNAFNTPAMATLDPNEIHYYSFVTLSTLGYGDITPKAPVAKSMAILASVSGQLYVAIIVALLVGKLSSTNQKS